MMHDASGRIARNAYFRDVGKSWSACSEAGLNLESPESYVSVLFRLVFRRRCELSGGEYRFYRLLSMNAVSCDFESAPTLVASTLPFLNSIRVGMPRTPKLDGVF